MQSGICGHEWGVLSCWGSKASKVCAMCVQAGKMKLYCVYGSINWEGEFNHSYFLRKCDAEAFKLLWEADMGYMDHIHLVGVTAIGDIGHSIPESELMDIIKEINK